MNASNSLIETLSVRVRFFGFYRIMEWVEQGSRNDHERLQRFQTYLNWHKDYKEKGVQKPYLRGTLVRSVTIRQLEEMFALFYRQFGKIVCSGQAFFRNDGTSRRSKFIRRRNRYANANRGICDHNKPEDACPFCQILGVCDRPGEIYNRDDVDRSVQFTNFSTNRVFSDIRDLAWERAKNRYDRNSRKARDYFKIWEADYYACQDYIGVIKINGKLVNDPEGVKCMLAAGLAGIRHLAGAPCRVDVVMNNGGVWDASVHGELLDRFKNRFLLPGQIDSSEEPEAGPDSFSPLPEPDKTKALKCAKEASETIIDIVNRTNSKTHLRSLADAIRELRRKSIVDLKNLPEIKKETETQSLWGLCLHASADGVGQIIKKGAKGLTQREFTLYTDQLGERLYQEAKKQKIVQPSPGRVLGENEYYGKTCMDDPGDQPVEAGALPPKMCEWFITGYLEAKAPFFLGIGPGSGQTDLQVLTDAHGRLRLSFDVLRGVLRRDLRTLLSGCNMEIGTFRLCDCPICELMSRCKFQDALALDYELPPETRQRIRISPHTGTVEKGALFSMELGPEGLRFPLILRFRSNSADIDQPLRRVLGSWADGNCLLGGNVGTGKGQFKLIAPKFFKISLESRRTKDTRLSYYRLLQTRHFMGFEKTKLEEALETDGYAVDNASVELPSPEIPDFTRVEYDLYFECPVLSNDPISAIFDGNMPDAVMFKKNRLIYDEKGGFKEIAEIYCLKGEGVRGPLRYLLGKREDLHDLPHDDCQCLMCRIFGSNQIGGHVRFGDMELDSDARSLRCDHVAIDWNGGGKEHAKYDDYPLAGSPEKAIKFTGAFWVSDALDENSKRAIRDAFVDLQDGMATIGAKGSIGYGWVAGVVFHDDAPDWLRDFPAPVKEILDRGPSGDGTLQGKAIEFSDGCKYNPYYYLMPEPEVNRTDDLITHEHYNEGRLSGKITCDLETLSPLFIPDTNDARALDVTVPENSTLVASFTPQEYDTLLKKYPAAHEKLEGVKKEHKGIVRIPIAAIKTEDIAVIGNDAYKKIVKYTPHKSHRFFRINDEIMLPGSELRGMIGVFYQSLTNSCFRNMNESTYITRRMDATEGGRIKSGVVTMDEEGNLYILEAKSYRLPLYDDVSTTARIGSLPTNDIIAKTAKKNRDFLERFFGKDDFKRKNVFQGLHPVKFNILMKNTDCWTNGADKIAVLHKNGKYSGLIKFTGLNAGNNANLPESGVSYKRFDEAWDPLYLNILLTSDHAVVRNSGKRPTLCCEANAYYIMTKRAERVFKVIADRSASKRLENLGQNQGVYTVSTKAKKEYEDVLDAYSDNTGKIVEAFRTQIVNKRLMAGDLVYFKPNGSEAENIVPVCISRKTDTQQLGKRFFPGYENLRPCDGECLDDCEEVYPNCLSEHVSRLPFRLCPTCGLFGTTHYKGRLRFGFARLIDPETEQKKANAQWYNRKGESTVGADGTPITIKLQERPRATWPLPNSDARVPGRKIYVNHPKGVTIEKADPTENNSTIEPLASGNSFRFQIEFENLSEAELGNLIYSIELEPGMAHRLGRGKPLGMGSVKIKVKDILIRNNIGIWGSGNDKLNYIDKGKEQFSSWFGVEKWDDLRHVRDLRDLLSVPKREYGLICYPDLQEYTTLKEKWSKTADFQARLITPWEPWNSISLSDIARKRAEKLQKLYDIRDRDKTLPNPVLRKGTRAFQKELKKDYPGNFRGSRYGKVKFFAKGYGFIEDDSGGKDVFVHHTGVLMKGFRKLQEGQRVNYDIIKTNKGLQAVNVKVIE